MVMEIQTFNSNNLIMYNRFPMNVCQSKYAFIGHKVDEVSIDSIQVGINNFFSLRTETHLIFDRYKKKKFFPVSSN